MLKPIRTSHRGAYRLGGQLAHGSRSLFNRNGDSLRAFRHPLGRVDIVHSGWPPVGVGAYMVFYDLFRERKLSIETLFNGFHDYNRITLTMLLVQVYTFLWTLLLIVPGIIKGCSYAMTPFILREHPELSYNAAIEKSMAMMEGNKMKFFLLCLSFIGWAILCVFTLGIGYLFLYPYIYTSFVAFYEDLKAQQEVVVEEVVVETV